jgi:hypothetical protein
MSNNALTGSIPNIFDKIPNLKNIVLDLNKFTGSIPESIYYTQLQLLNLNNNKLIGSLSNNIYNLRNLTIINLSWNSLSGTLPDKLSMLSNLNMLKLNNNQMTGPIPVSYGYGLENTKYVDISNNNLIGTIPNDMAKHYYEYYDISNNKLHGYIPRDSFLRSKIKYLNMSGNNFNGCAPFNIPLFDNTSKCNLGGNYYEGCIDNPINCDITFKNNCEPNSLFYGQKCTPCNCSNGKSCVDGVNGTGECISIVVDVCLNNKCEGGCVASGLNYTCVCTLPGILNITDQVSCICPKGFYKKNKGACYPCEKIDNCFSNVYCTNTNDSFCEVCENGFYKNNNVCNSCTKIPNCFSSIKCTDSGNSVCSLCDNGYELSIDSRYCVVNKNCDFTEWSSWSICSKCDGGFKTRTRNLSSNNTALPIYCQGYMANFSACGYPCVDETITTKESAIQYLYSSLTQWDWLSEQLNTTLDIYRNENAITVKSNNDCSIVSQISFFMSNTAANILPNVDKNVYIGPTIDAHNCSVTMNIQKDKNNTSIIIGVLVSIMIVIFIMLFFIYRYYISDAAWIKLLPKDVQCHFVKEGSDWVKEENMYIKKLSDAKDINRFRDIWDRLSTEGIIVSEVYSIHNPILGSAFANHREILNQRMETTPTLFNKKTWILEQDDNNMRTYVNERYNEIVKKNAWNNPEDITPIVASIHGTDFNIAKSIASKGFCALASLDAGFYGKGIYFTTYTNYAIPYFMNKSEPAVLVTLGTFGNIYPVIEHPQHYNNLVGKPLISGYQSHFVLTNSEGYPIKTKNNSEEYNEFVVSQEAQVVPIYIVKISKNINDMMSMKKLLEKDRPIQVSTSTSRLNVQLLSNKDDTYIEMSDLSM